MSESFVRTRLHTYTQGDLAGCVACYPDDSEFEDPTFGEHVKGKEARCRAFSSVFFTGVTMLRFLAE